MLEAPSTQPVAPPRAPPPRLGFAGVGWIGRNRLEAIARSGYGEVAAICDPQPEAAARAVQFAPESTVVGQFDDLLDLDLDGIVIATPNALHAKQAIAALERGLAVFCQKPLARDAAETQRVITAARAADRLLHVDLSYRFTTGMRLIRDLIQRGELGDIYAIEGVFHNAYGPDKPWFLDAALSGGGCLLDLGIHLVDLALWCLDFPAVEKADGQILTHGTGRDLITQTAVENYASALLSLATGTSVQLACSWKAPAGCDARIALTFFGTRGGALFRNVKGSFYDFTAEHLQPDRTRRILSSPPEDWGGRAAVEWSRRLGESAGFDPEIEKLNPVAQTLDRIYGQTR